MNFILQTTTEDMGNMTYYKTREEADKAYQDAVMTDLYWYVKLIGLGDEHLVRVYTTRPYRFFYIVRLNGDLYENNQGTKEFDNIEEAQDVFDTHLDEDLYDEILLIEVREDPNFKIDNHDKYEGIVMNEYNRYLF